MSEPANIQAQRSVRSDGSGIALNLAPFVTMACYHVASLIGKESNRRFRRPCFEPFLAPEAMEFLPRSLA
jgi:hypothetical protein